MSRHSKKAKIVSLLLALSLIFTYDVPIASIAYASDGAAKAPYEAPWQDSIHEMLSSGDYEQGVVICGIDMSKAKGALDPASALEASQLQGDAEELIKVDGGSSEPSKGFFAWLDELKDKLTGKDDGICIISIHRDDMTTEEILELLADDESVVFAEPNYIALTTDEDGSAPSRDASGDAADARDISSLQWSSSEDASLHAAGDVGEVSISVPGWPDGSNMDHEIIVAVVDMPVDFTHPDLAGAAYTFSAELQEKLGCDEHGYNAKWDSTTGGKLDYWPGANHGTHVGGIIGATWDGHGTSGVASNVRIVSVQNSFDGNTSLIDTLRAYSFIKDAIDAGVEIRAINNSWVLKQTSKAIDAAVTELGEHGAISLFAAGNSGKDLNAEVKTGALLADNPYAIIVASTDPAGNIAGSSSYGKGIVDLGAPGAGIMSTILMDSAMYIPVIAQNNKFYEDFEDPEAFEGNPTVRICQIGYTEGDWGILYPDPEKVVEGTYGVVVSGQDGMGFEGDYVLKVPIDRSITSGYNMYAFMIDLGDVSDLGIVADAVDPEEDSIFEGDGDSLGFGFGATDATSGMRVVEATHSSDAQYAIVGNNADCMATFDCMLVEGSDLEHLRFLITLQLGDAEELYFDAIGIGDEKHAYGFMSGTSMATPAVTGAAAVLASRHYDELSGMDGPSYATALATLVRSSTRPIDSLADKTNTGGIIDLSVETSVEQPTVEQSPDIAEATIDGDAVVLTGTGFGEDQGTAIVRKYVVGAFSDVESTVFSWSDERVELSLSEDFEGIIEVVLTAQNGKKDTIVQFVSKSGNLFEEDHHLGSETGDSLAFDDPGMTDADAETLGDIDTFGLLIAGDAELFWMPYAAQVEKNPAYKTLYSYDPDSDSWSICPALPVWLRNVSGAFVDGTLYVKGSSVDTDESGNIPYYDEDPYSDPGEPYIFSYTPGDADWKDCSVEGVTAELTIFSADGALLLAGITGDESWEYEEDFPAVREYDPENGAGSILGTSSMTLTPNPKVAYAGGYLYAFDEYAKYITVLDGDFNDTGDVIDMPEFYHSEFANKRDGENEILLDVFTLTAYDDMLILFGPAAKDGSSDTYVLKAGETSFQPYDKRASDAEVLLPSAAVLDDELYAIGGSVFEPGKRIFRSTMLKEEEPAETFTITYKLNGGAYNGSTADITEEYPGGTIISIHPAPTRDGYIFTYWEGSAYQPNDEYTVEGDHTFTAQWEKASDQTPDKQNTPDAPGTGPNTGDNVPVRLLLFAAALSLIAMLSAVLFLRKERNR